MKSVASRRARLPELVSYLETLPEPHILLDAQYRILSANAAYRAEFAGRGSVIGRTCHDVSHGFAVPCDRAGESCPMARARHSGQRERVLHLHHTPQGEAYVNIELVPLRNAEGELAYFVEKMEPLRMTGGAVSAPALIGRSAPFQETLELVARVGPSEAAVLLLGESGTGKELVARAVHEASARASRPLVVVDCASLPETLFESELFGHEKGAFTGAQASRAGLVEAAAGGTLFLDEVGDIPLAMQVKLLRLLESGTYRRVGSTELRRADVRLVSATHRDLEAMVRDGRFRQDLFYRLSTFPILLPPLRVRGGDIALLADSLLGRVAPNRRLKLSSGALARLARHPFPGNVRELRNLLERAALLTDGEVIGEETIARALAVGGRPVDAWVRADGAAAHGGAEPACKARSGAASSGAGAGGPPFGLERATPAARRRAAQREALLEALARHRGSREELARSLGISLRTLYRRLESIQRP